MSNRIWGGEKSSPHTELCSVYEWLGWGSENIDEAVSCQVRGAQSAKINFITEAEARQFLFLFLNSNCNPF